MCRIKKEVIARETANKGQGEWKGTKERKEGPKSNLSLLKTAWGPGPSFGALGHSYERQSNIPIKIIDSGFINVNSPILPQGSGGR